MSWIECVEGFPLVLSNDHKSMSELLLQTLAMQLFFKFHFLQVCSLRIGEGQVDVDEINVLIKVLDALNLFLNGEVNELELPFLF